MKCLSHGLVVDVIREVISRNVVSALLSEVLNPRSVFTSSSSTFVSLFLASNNCLSNTLFSTENDGGLVSVKIVPVKVFG